MVIEIGRHWQQRAATEIRIDPSRPPGDAPCPNCGHLLWFSAVGGPDSDVLVVGFVESEILDSQRFEHSRPRAARYFAASETQKAVAQPPRRLVHVFGDDHQIGNAEQTL